MPKVSEEHRAARRDQIVGAMLRCVAREGFHKTTMAAVIEESGLSAGAVYLYFRGKHDLIRAIAETAVAGVAGIVEAQAAAEEVPTPEQAVAAATQGIVDLGDELGVELHRVALQAWAEAARDPDILAIIQREAERIRSAWIAYAERAIAAGHLPERTDPVGAGLALIGLLPGFMVQRLVFDEVTPESYAAGLGNLRGRPPG